MQIQNYRVELVEGKPAFMIQGEDRSASVADILEYLTHLKIAITAIYPLSADSGRFAALIWGGPLR